jgi:hypothetical protein
MDRRLGILLLAAAVLAGCGGGSSSNGEETKAAARVVADTRAAVDQASIVHVTGAGRADGQPLKLDLWIADGKGKGHLEEGGLDFDFVRIGSDIYVRATSAFWKRFGGGALGQLLADKWVEVPSSRSDVASIAQLADKKVLFASVLGQHGKIVNKGTVDYHGQKAVEIRDATRNGSLFVADEGTPYPLAVEGSSLQGTVRFSDWNGDETIAAPKGALDFSKLGG